MVSGEYFWGGRAMSQVGVFKPVSGLLTEAGLRSTRQRLALGHLLFDYPHRHVTAEQLHEEVLACGIRLSLATIYNTLNKFTRSGLLREVVVETGRSYFDTNCSAHHHFFYEDTGLLTDIPDDCVTVVNLPNPPAGLRVARVDVIVRLSP
ncbi:Fur family transcriptional regulator, iron response regulator [uncultured Gammaproteobacteria bacterium]